MDRKIGRRELTKALATSTLIAIVVVGLVLAIGRPGNRENLGSNGPSEGSAQLRGDDSVPRVELTETRDFSAAEALSENAKLPFSTEPIEPATPFYLSRHLPDPLLRKLPTDCLSRAIYYEAGFQSDQEKRAVAQVILNRVRHPAFPSSICKVVYQGSERVTGCQFTFTCDGSESRRPEARAWNSAKNIALSVLEGAVEDSVGMATHFHADYVQPYWAPNLTKIEHIGRHIFYRWNGAWGRRAAFTQMPLADETVAVESLDLVPIVTPVEIPAPQGSAPRSDIIADSAKLQPQRDNFSPKLSDSQRGLLADEAAGGLIEDEKKRSRD